MTVEAFTIHISQATLDHLHHRLAHTRWPDEIEGAGWDYGTNLDYLKSLMTYWQNQFDWRAQEARLNQFAQFRTGAAPIEGAEGGRLTLVSTAHRRGSYAILRSLCLPLSLCV